MLTLSLLALLVMVMMTLSLLLQSEMKMATLSQDREHAKENALLALQEALGRLQASSGPDQRSTARADILSDTNRENAFWTGVWPTIHPDDPEWDLETVRAWAYEPDQVEWLVSSTGEPTPDADLSSLNPEGVKPLAYYYNEDTETDEPVNGGLVPLVDEGVTKGRYAWWVSDEGIKAKFNLPDTGEGGSVGSAEERLQTQSGVLLPAQFGIGSMSEFPSDVDYDALSSSVLQQMGSLSDMTLASESFEGTERTLGKDVTFHSNGVLANQRHGGLKLDLTRALDDSFPDYLAGRPLWWFRDPDNGRVIRGEYWDVLYDYANLYRPYPHWQFSGTVKDQAYDYTYEPHSGSGPEGLSDSGDWDTALPIRFFGPETTSGNGSFNRQGKNMGAYSYYSIRPTNSYVGENWGYSESGNAQGRPVWNGVKPVVLASLWRVGIGSSDLLTYSQSSAFEQDGAATNSVGPLYDLRQHDGTDIVYDHPGGAGYGDHPLDLPGDWEGRPASGDSAIQGVAKKYYRLHFVLQPVVVLWNPYNVPLRVTDMLVTPKFEPWVSIDYDDGSGSGVKPVKVQKYMYYRDGGVDNAFRVVEDYPHSIYGGSSPSNNPSEADDRFLLADDGVMAGGELVSGIRIDDYVLEPGQIEVFSLNQNTVLPNSFGGEMVARPINTDAVLVRRNPLKHDFPEGTRINNIHLFYDPENVADANSVDGRLHTMSMDVQLLNQDLSPGTKSDVTVQQISQLAPDAPSRNDWDEERIFEVNANIEDILAPYAGNNMDINEPFNDVVWFAVIGAQTKSIEESDGGLPMFSQFNPMRFRDGPNPSDIEMSGKLWRAKFYTDPEFQDAVENEDLPFWDGDSEVWNGVDRIIAKELPRQPLGSVGQLMHANLSINDWDPLYAVGGSYASPFVDRTEFYNKFNLQTGGNSVTGYDNLVPDVSFLANERLFDQYFFSTVPSQNSDAGKPGYSATFDPNAYSPFKRIDDEDLLAGEATVNERMTFIGDASDIDGVGPLDRIRDAEDAASMLLVDGAFNVNSTSVDAWKAFFASLQGRSMVAADGTELAMGEQATFPRTSSMAFGADEDEDSLFAGFKSLTDQELEDLANAMVEEVVQRGPFLSLSDFVNRRLEDSALGAKGAIQAALDDSINQPRSRFGDEVGLGDAGDIDADLWLEDRQGNDLLRRENLVEQQGAGVAQWILQNDVLQVMTPFIQARSDTFVIRAYGETLGIVGEEGSQAWCEAVVQRLPDYVDSDDQEPTVKPYLVTTSTNGDRLDDLELNAALRDINQQFGRRYQVISFRWLEEDTL